MKIFNREPAAVVAVLIAVLAAWAAFEIPGVNAGQAFAAGGLLTAALLAWTTKPRTPGVLTGVLTALAALLGEYGLHWTDAQVTALSGVVLTGYALISRAQITPAADPRPDRVV